MLVLVLAACVLCLHNIGASAADKFYIYDWPDLVDRYANFTDRSHHGHGVEIPQWKQHFGAGRQVDSANMEHKTSQFGLFKLVYERALMDSVRRTLLPERATSFIIPFDIGMHAAFLETNGRMRRTNCPLSDTVMHRLKNSVHFNRNFGHDHTVIFSVNQNLNYFMGAQKCVDFMRMCWNCTKLSIDEYMFIARDRNFELKNRGVNWHAVPFPSDYHYSHSEYAAGAKAAATRGLQYDLPWQNFKNRSIIVSFVGNTRRYNDISTRIREALVHQCSNHRPQCQHGAYKHDNKVGQHHVSRSSIFCLQPPGDMPTRKSLFDAVLSGCIPVLFHPLTARYMYEWHLGQTDWDALSLSFDSIAENEQLFSHEVDFVQRLIDISERQPAVVKNKQAALRDLAYQLQFSLIEQNNEGVCTHVPYNKMHDAYDIMMDRTLAIHSGRERHDRKSWYLSCDQIKGAGGVLLQTADRCNVTGSSTDPYAPSAFDNYLFGRRGLESRD